MPKDEFAEIKTMNSEEFGQSDLLSQRRRFPEKALSKPFFCNFWSIRVISIPG
jgi:hypothetical protein